MAEQADLERDQRPPSADHGHDHAHPEHETHDRVEDWGDEAFVTEWLARQAQQADVRRRRFALVRAVIPRLPEQEFRYLNLGAGPGDLDEMLLEQFPGAAATLVDASLLMLAEARRRLERFGNRVEYVQGNLSTPQWRGGIGDGFDFAISTNAVHHAGDGNRIAALYGEIYDAVGHGGIVLNLDRVRTEDPSVGALAAWATRDPEAGLDGPPAHAYPGLAPLSDHIAWLRAAGFRSVDILWKDLGRALLFGVRDHFHMPQAAHGSSDNPGHAH